MSAPDDNNKRQVKRMHQISNKFGERVRVGYIQGEDVLFTLTSTVMRSLAWTLPAITQKKECTHIMAPAICHVLSKLKIVKTIKRKVIYGPTYMQGMGIKNLYILLGDVHLVMIV